MLTFSLRHRPKEVPRTGVFRDRRGLVASEYALLAAGLVVIAGGATIAFRSNLLTAFANIGTQILATADRIAGRHDTASATRTSDAAQDEGARRRVYDEHTLRWSE